MTIYTSNKILPIRKKAIRGDRDAVNLLTPMTHEWSWDMAQDQFHNFWLPTEISMAPDALSFKQDLSEAEKESFIHVVSALSSMDLVIGRNIAVAIYPIITSPEIEVFLDSQIMLEGIHKWAYHLMLQGIGIDEEYAYTRYIHVPEIAHKFY